MVFQLVILAVVATLLWALVATAADVWWHTTHMPWWIAFMTVATVEIWRRNARRIDASESARRLALYRFREARQNTTGPKHRHEHVEGQGHG